MIILLINIFLGSQPSNLRLDPTLEGILPTGDPAIPSYNAFRDQFGREDFLFAAVRSNNIFQLAFLERLQKLHADQLENVPYVGEIKSLIYARITRGKNDLLTVEGLFDQWPKSRQEVDAKRKHVNSVLTITVVSILSDIPQCSSCQRLKHFVSIVILS